MAKKKAAAASVSVDAHKHIADKRPNIPTRETAAFAADDGIGKAIYERDRSLDPQLVWKGKDEKPLEVPAVPLHVQEKIHPQAIVEDVKRRAAGPKPGGSQLDLFADFNGLDDFAKKLEFYEHDQNWTNRLILGDSLLVMTSLAEKERLRGQVQCIYFDPPYGIKFGSNWQVSTRQRDVKDAKAEDLTRQPEQIKAFRDTWELGIHSYLSYMRDRITAARDLLSENGSLFIQIGDENLHLVRSLMDEVFGSDNNISLITFKKTSAATAQFLGGVADYLLWYARDREHLKYREIFQGKELDGRGGEQYTRIELSDGHRTRNDGTAQGRPYRIDNLTSARVREARTGYYKVEFEGKEFWPGQREWSTHQEGMKKLRWARRLEAAGNTLTYVRYLDDYPLMQLSNVWDDTIISGFSESKQYVVQTSTRVIERCILMTTEPGDLVLDPTCGSGTTAHVAEQWGRRWITIDTSRVALALARTRMMAARFPYYLLTDSSEGRKKQAELTATIPDPAAPPPRRDMHKGFVYRTVPHVTLKSIANNPDIQEGMTREQIDKAIARHAESETLYDQPYEDKDVVRLTGPFTVESLSPHRSLPAVLVADEPTGGNGASPSSANFGQMILDNLL